MSSLLAPLVRDSLGRESCPLPSALPVPAEEKLPSPLSDQDSDTDATSPPPASAPVPRPIAADPPHVSCCRSAPGSGAGSSRKAWPPRCAAGGGATPSLPGPETGAGSVDPAAPAAARIGASPPRATDDAGDDGCPARVGRPGRSGAGGKCRIEIRHAGEPDGSGGSWTAPDATSWAPRLPVAAESRRHSSSATPLHSLAAAPLPQSLCAAAERRAPSGAAPAAVASRCRAASAVSARLRHILSLSLQLTEACSTAERAACIRLCKASSSATAASRSALVASSLASASGLAAAASTPSGSVWHAACA
mmetsp:Transcript_24780/g.93731  ORF Transcript_24780/g.93731 Transcript_24780/m.93731 type:complete len:307 (+) Transcript_24780:416-1336(+)